MMNIKEFREILSATNGDITKERKEKIKKFVREKISEERELFEILAKL